MDLTKAPCTAGQLHLPGQQEASTTTPSATGWSPRASTCCSAVTRAAPARAGGRPTAPAAELRSRGEPADRQATRLPGGRRRDGQHRPAGQHRQPVLLRVRRHAARPANYTVLGHGHRGPGHRQEGRRRPATTARSRSRPAAATRRRRSPSRTLTMSDLAGADHAATPDARRLSPRPSATSSAPGATTAPESGRRLGRHLTTPAGRSWWAACRRAWPVRRRR